MSLQVCSINSCGNNSNDINNPAIYFYYFPTHDQNIRNEWIKQCNRGEDECFWLSDLSTVCSKHFCEDDYEQNLEADLIDFPSHQILKRNAIPSLYLDVLYDPNIIEMDPSSLDENRFIVEVIEIPKTEYDSLKKEKESMESYVCFLKEIIAGKERYEKELISKVDCLERRIVELENVKLLDIQTYIKTDFKEKLRKELMENLLKKNVELCVAKK